jgi:hypothetical protein
MFSTIFSIISATNTLIALGHTHGVSVAPRVHEQLFVMQYKFSNRGISTYDFTIYTELALLFIKSWKKCF